MEYCRKLLIPILTILLLITGCSNNDKLQSKRLYEAINNNNLIKVEQILNATNLKRLPVQEQIKPEVLAATLDEFDITNAILEAGGSWKSKDINGNNLLQIAAVNGNEKLISKLLKDKKANINMPNKLGMTPLLLAIAPSATKPDRVHFVKWLIQNGANPESYSNEGYTALHIAAQQNQPEIINYLLQYKQLMNKKDLNGRTPLIIAVQSGNSRSVKELLNNGSNPLLKDNDGKTAQMYAQEYGLKEIQAIIRLSKK